jgi:GNAT superfamily N-acetyltransferase
MCAAVTASGASPPWHSQRVWTRHPVPARQASAARPAWPRTGIRDLLKLGRGDSRQCITSRPFTLRPERNQKGTHLSICFASTLAEIRDCFEVVSELRPHLSLQEYAASVSRMTSSAGYKLAYLRSDEVKAVAGIRISEWLHSGRYLEIEDLVTRSEERSQGHGSAMFNWIRNYAIANECKQLRLVSGIDRIGAHRFYERHGMVFEAKYFSLALHDFVTP